MGVFLTRRVRESREFRHRSKITQIRANTAVFQAPPHSWRVSVGPTAVPVRFFTPSEKTPLFRGFRNRGLAPFGGPSDLVEKSDRERTCAANCDIRGSLGWRRIESESRRELDREADPPPAPRPSRPAGARRHIARLGSAPLGLLAAAAAGCGTKFAPTRPRAAPTRPIASELPTSSR